MIANSPILIDELDSFIERLNITHYFTLTYARRLGWEGRYKAFHAWLNLIERQQRRPLGWLRADERRFSGLGFPEIPEHHHGLLIDTGGLVCKDAENLWRAKYGDARVEPYRRNGGAVRYCLKHALYDGQWDLGGKALRLGAVSRSGNPKRQAG